MPAPLAVAGVVLGAVGLISSFLGSKKASSAAKEQSRLEAEAERKVTDERIYQLGQEERQLYGETLAGYAGGGVTVGNQTNSGAVQPIGSVRSVLDEQATTFAREKKITQEVGATKVAQSLAGGKATADAYKYSGYANTASGISNILTNWKLMS